MAKRIVMRRLLDPFRFKWNRFCFLNGEANRKEGGEGRTGGPAKSG